MLEAFQKLVGEAGGFVEAEAGSGIGGFRIRVTLNPLEEPIDHAHVVVKVRVQRRDRPQFDPAEPKPVPEDDFDQSWGA